uniref:DUF4218 domain-containing protein n=1 Tax=Tanacetum cinerariifolium TaxID=118510 RepID=A0A6L2NXG7_TANCI|nr:hypothetical protein [Tanacetum cinerariifolium]
MRHGFDLGKTRLAKVGHSKWLVARPNQNREVLEASGCVFFHTREPEKFCQFIKGVKLPDGFGSSFKHKVTDKDTNITGPKSHDCHIMMQCLLPYGIQQYLPDKIAKPIIELRSLFKQICSATLMEDDMLKAQIKVVDILCDLEFIYHPALFDIMIHLVIYLPLEDLKGGPIRPQWMFPFERYMKKLKVYVRNKAKPEVCKSIGLTSFIRFDAQELKKVKWYVLHNSPEIDTYLSQFKSLFPNKDMKEEFLTDNDKDTKVSTTSELFALACRPTWTPISVNSCVVDGVRYDVNSRDKCRTTQNNGICSPSPNGEMYYGQLQEILEFKYLLFKVVLFRVKWFDTRNQGRKVKCLVFRNNMTQIDCRDGQSTKVDAPPDIIDVHDEDDDIIDDEDALPHDLADFDDEDLISVDDDGVDKMSVDVARSHGGDGGGVDRPPPHHVPTGKGKRKPNLVCRTTGRLHTRDKTWNLLLKEITDKKGPVLIWFEVRDKQTLMPLGDHAAHWSSYIGEVIIAYNTNKAAFKAQHWVIDPETGTYNLEKIRPARPEGITVKE